jgi:hypothetical protein
MIFAFNLLKLTLFIFQFDVEALKTQGLTLTKEFDLLVMKEAEFIFFILTNGPSITYLTLTLTLLPTNLLFYAA